MNIKRIIREETEDFQWIKDGSHRDHKMPMEEMSDLLYDHFRDSMYRISVYSNGDFSIMDEGGETYTSFANKRLDYREGISIQDVIDELLYGIEAPHIPQNIRDEYLTLASHIEKI